MQQLHLTDVEISIENIIVFQNSRKAKAFMKSEVNRCSGLTEDYVFDSVNDMDVSTGGLELFHETFTELYDIAFARMTASVKDDFTYHLGYNDKYAIVARAKAIVKLYGILNRHKLKERKDAIQATANNINQGSSYVRVWSNKVNSLVGGWSKGFVGSFIGRPSHNKSTYMTYDSVWQIKSESLDRVDIIGTEEPSEVFWRRIFGIELGIPIRDMIEGVAKVSDEDVRIIKERYEDKIYYHKVSVFKDVIDLMYSLRSPYIWLDHVNSVVYPNENMFAGIISLVNRQKQYLAEYPDTVIVDLSQVNTKEMKKKGKLFPSKEDAYCSSVLEQASREFLAIYYPYRDLIDKEEQHRWVGKKNIPKQSDVQLSIEKNSFGDVGVLDFKYIPDYARFADTPEMAKGQNIQLPSKNKQTLLFEGSDDFFNKQ